MISPYRVALGGLDSILFYSFLFSGGMVLSFGYVCVCNVNSKSGYQNREFEMISCTGTCRRLGNILGTYLV